MAEIKAGSVTVVLPEKIEVLEKAGKLTPDEIAKNPDKPRPGVGLACKLTATAIKKYPELFKGLQGVTTEELADHGFQADEMDVVLVDLDIARSTARQNNFLLDSRAHRDLRRVLSYIRDQAKFNPEILKVVPHLTRYFSNKQGLGEELELPEEE